MGVLSPSTTSLCYPNCSTEVWTGKKKGFGTATEAVDCHRGRVPLPLTLVSVTVLSAYLKTNIIHVFPRFSDQNLIGTITRLRLESMKNRS